MWMETQSDESTPATWPETADAELVWAEPGFRVYHRPGGFFVAVGERQPAPRAESTSAAIEEILAAVIDAADQEILEELSGDSDERTYQLIVDLVMRYRQRQRLGRRESGR